MNQSYPYPIPGSIGNLNAFIADNTGVLGDVDQALDERTLITIDYSQLTPGVTLTGYSFRVSPGGSPQLSIGGSILGATSLSFYVSGGIGGRQYQVKVIVTLGDTERRSDVLNVNVLGDGGGCSLPMPALGLKDATSGDGSIIVNEAPRFFVSGTPPVGANVLDRWYNTTDGLVYDYISTGVGTLWSLVSSGGGGGGGGGSSSTIRKLISITPDGATAQFTLTSGDGTPVAITNSSYLMVSQDGVWQEPGLQYVASGSSITFAQPPAADAQIFMLWFAGS
jgi:hypothetical protein